VRAAQWLPALLVGLLAGVLIDRVRRRSAMVAADAASAVLFATIAALALAGTLTVPVLVVLVLGVGTATTVFTAAHQSFLPGLVPQRLLPVANARVDQVSAVGESAGPLLAGLLVRVLSAPVAVLVNAASFAVSAVLLATIRTDEPAPPARAGRNLRGELVEGARWVYRHPTLGPYALSLHLWFLGNSTVMTVLVFYAVTDLGLGPVTVGLVLACAGASAVVGAGLAPGAARRWGLGRVCVLADWLTALAFTCALLARPGAAGVALLVAGQLLWGLGGGITNPLTLSYRNAVTPPALRGRMNATIRSVNWGSIAVSAPLAGLAATAWGNRPVIAAGVVVVAVASLTLTLSPFRRAQMPEGEPA
jgi:MFS family permease